MRNMFQKLWNDDQGALLSTEWVLVAAITLFGIIPGLVATRNSINSARGTIANGILALSPNYSFAGFTILGSGGSTIATVAGFSYNAGTQTYFVSSPATTLGVTGTYVNPAP
jgi:hypothetical protein